MLINIFHDLRNPIFSALGLADLLSAESDTERQKIEVMKEKLSFLSQLSEQLLLIAKLGESQVKFHFMEIDFSQLVSQLCEEYTVDCQSKRIKLESSIEDNIIVNLDSFRTSQAIRNLFQNAYHYTPAGGTITVTLKKSGAEAIFEVMDNGQGISEEDLPYIFERYYRGSLSDQDKSSGLGLSIAKEIIQAEKGNISAVSKVGEGTTFIVTFPVVTD